MGFRIWVVVVALLAAPGLRAQQEEISDFEELDLEELLDVVFTVSKHRQSIFWSPSAASVYNRDDIQSSGATTLADFLRRVPGFDVYRVKSSYPLVGARALTTASNNRVLVLVDGREALAEVTGFAFWDFLTIDLEEVERIEVIRGPGSALYGANAFAAVVNITTVAESPASGGSATMTLGEDGHQRLFGRARDSVPAGDGTLSFGAGLGLEGMRSPTDNRNQLVDAWRSHGYVRYRKGEDLDLSLHAGLVYGEGVVYIQMGDIGFEEGLNYWAMGKSDVGLGESVRLKGQLYYTSYAGYFSWQTDLRAYDIWVADIPTIYVEVNTLDAQVQLDWDLLESLLCIVGANFRYNFLDLENATATEMDEIRAAGFIHLQWSPVEILQLTGGLRLDVDTATDQGRFSPRVAAVVRPWQNHAFRLSYGLAFRRPSYFENRIHSGIESYNPATPEIVGLSRTQFGNEDVGSEQVHSIEAGWRGRFLGERLQLSADLFFSMYRDTITFVVAVPERMGFPDIANSTIQYRSEGAEADAFGGEVEAVLRPGDAWMFWCNLGARKVINIADDQDMPSEPHWRVNLGGRYQPADGMLADVALHYVSEYRIPLIDPANALDEPSLMQLGDQLQIISRVGYRIRMGEDREIEAGLVIRTPLGSPFREYAGIPRSTVLQSEVASDFGGETVVRMLSFYLRGSF
jgi:iron complex outermembrane receptor protein